MPAIAAPSLVRVCRLAACLKRQSTSCVYQLLSTFRIRRHVVSSSVHIIGLLSL